ncbi:hypothetical protein NOVOSPHI9U_290005 [Novosphingobium sp. 9U]|nr:hypothetical protein NOVOSPHI9U_290005 [Novosphingobium sp. 9U]
MEVADSPGSAAFINRKVSMKFFPKTIAVLSGHEPARGGYEGRRLCSAAPSIWKCCAGERA